MSQAPEELLYTPSHIWVDLLDGRGVVRIGVTGYAQESLGEIVFVWVPQPGGRVEAGSSLGDIESTKVTNDLVAPVSGTVLARNEPVVAKPASINSDPYGSWLLEIQAGGLDQSDFLSWDEYRSSTAGSA